MGETEARPECLFGPTRWRAEGWGRAGVWIGVSRVGQRQLVEERGLGGWVSLLEILQILAVVLTWASLLCMCVCVGVQWGEEKLTLGGGGIYVGERLGDTE